MKRFYKLSSLTLLYTGLISVISIALAVIAIPLILAEIDKLPPSDWDYGPDLSGLFLLGGWVVIIGFIIAPIIAQALFRLFLTIASRKYKFWQTRISHRFVAVLVGSLIFSFGFAYISGVRSNIILQNTIEAATPGSYMNCDPDGTNCIEIYSQDVEKAPTKTSISEKIPLFFSLDLLISSIFATLTYTIAAVILWLIQEGMILLIKRVAKRESPIAP